MEALAQVAAVRSRLDGIVAAMRPYSVSNESATRTLDADDADGTISNPPTQAEVQALQAAVLTLADVVGTLIEDLKALR